jgi:hypothetical protein
MMLLLRTKKILPRRRFVKRTRSLFETNQRCDIAKHYGPFLTRHCTLWDLCDTPRSLSSRGGYSEGYFGADNPLSTTAFGIIGFGNFSRKPRSVLLTPRVMSYVLLKSIHFYWERIYYPPNSLRGSGSHLQ